MTLVFLITLLSLMGTIVHSAACTNITSCDAPPNNTTCFQRSCPQPSCNMFCGLAKRYDGNCEQRCNGSTCDVMQCTASGRCMQRCFAGEKCASMDCDAKNCHHICDGGTCGILTCAKHDGRNTTFCEQYLGGGSGQLICEANKCHQRCISGNCTLTCTSNVKVCIQICDETCTMNCQAEECVPICRAWASCTVTTTVMPTIKNRGSRPQLTDLLGLVLVFATAIFM